MFTKASSNFKNTDGVLFAAPGTYVNKDRLFDLLSRGVISMDEWVKVADILSEEEIAKAFITYSVGKVIPCAPDNIKIEVREMLVEKAEDKRVSFASGGLGRRSFWSYQHSMRVAIMATAIGRACHFSEDRLEIIAEGAMVHDVGKIFFIPLIEKHNSLTKEEYAQIKEHTKAGCRLLKGAGFSDSIANAALLHHERLDGSGYWGEKDLPAEIQAIALADTIDAMAAARPYKEAESFAKVICKLYDEQSSVKAYNEDMVRAAKGLSAI